MLGTGRCGSLTFARACDHMTNYTASHETYRGRLMSTRADTPDNHIEVDNRLSWMLGVLEHHYGNDAYYVHLTRDRESLVGSFAKRTKRGIINSYKQELTMGAQENHTDLEICHDYVNTITLNVNAFLKDKTNKVTIPIEDARPLFKEFWESIGAQGDQEAALNEFDINHNSSSKPKTSGARFLSRARGLFGGN